jgi:hypothetical protein
VASPSGPLTANPANHRRPVTEDTHEVTLHT